MTRFGQGHSKWVNLNLKHITATCHSDIPRGARGGEGERKKYSGSETERGTESYERERKDNERNLKAIPFIMRMTLMFPFITIGSHWGEGESGQGRRERKSTNTRKKEAKQKN